MRRAIQILIVLIFTNFGLFLFIGVKHDWRAYLMLSGIILILFLLLSLYIEHGRRYSSQNFFYRRKRGKVQKDKGHKDEKPNTDGISFESKYRERNSGLSWNRESLHSSNSTRGSYRKFLRSFKKR